MSNFELNIETAGKIISSRQLISEPGKYMVRVTGVQPYNDDDRGLVSICNFAAMTPYHVEQAKELGAEGDLQGATNQQLTASQRVGIDMVPAKGDRVYIFVEERTTSTGVTGLFVTSVSAVEVKKASTIGSWSFEPVAEAEEVEDIPA